MASLSLRHGLRWLTHTRVASPLQLLSRRGFCEESAHVVPEVEQLLKEVNMEEYAEKFSSLQEFIDTSSFELKTKKEVDTIKHRKLILRQSELGRQLLKLKLIKEAPPSEPAKEETMGDSEEGVQSEEAAGENGEEEAR
eukprot:CAMPEP_0184479174 /NCGR_PEP_ID=MMETSP0113_2-20130426/1004_1 /TAXON_ID=91329 /ORGANISM="Norrisiella sphaerica, Strain BC52" /LENGTH=138 /DNA_ID=CAMNT_0026857199 /DNA_START=13 /DNA_END=429 /DNA_ORIENTATION=+